MSGFEGVKVKTVSRIAKFVDPDGSIYRLLRSGAPLEHFLDRAVEVKTVEGNVFLIEGVNFIWNCIVNGTCDPPFNSQNSYIGVGNGTTAESNTQTGLQGTNKYYKLVDSGYPVVSDNKITFRATFGPDEANFSWNEWTIANGPGDDYINLNRKVESLGTKTSGATWVLEVTLTIT